MYNQCESCRKMINSADDCRLTSNDGVKIHTYCRSCFDKNKKAVEKPKVL